MRVVRLVKTPVVLATLGFSLLALGVLPTALCCQSLAESRTHAGPEACPHAGEDGEACPLHQAPLPVHPSGCEMLESCSTDGLLGVLFTLTGALPEPVSELRVEFLHEGSLAVAPLSSASLDPTPHAPPPRA